MPDIHHLTGYILLAVAAFAGGAVNSVAGGGTLITFPSLVAFGVPVLTANGTNTVALVPASFSAAVQYRNEFGKTQRLLLLLAIPSIVGGIIGAKVAVRINDHAYGMVVPWLILLATVLFMANGAIGNWIRKRANPSPALRADPPRNGKGVITSPAILSTPSEAEGVEAIAPATPHAEAVQILPPALSEAEGVGAIAPAASQPEGGRDADTSFATHHVAGTMIFQLLVAIYGGFFGAGIGILMLAALGFLGLTNIHRMNALKNVMAVCINLVASFTFIFSRRVDWTLAILMAVAASMGGMIGARFAMRLGQARVRQIVVGIGFAITAWMFWKQLHNL